ncbi:uncharacterized protein LOC116132669 [Pistacia vera]|uniref:uncharacterized protein LOC116132669 n=1 Tax=Pistacia vera TaxID=55513 RepID=UPI001262C33F|nr:uncharacterized protein LOC116132669 [Pistacia vera]
MDESWRMRMGSSMQSLPSRKSMAEVATRHSFTSTTLDPEDFADVFGGPPRTLLSRKFSSDFTNSSSFYAEIFRNPSPELLSPPKMRGRVLPAFRIPVRCDGFYGDVFSYTGRKSRERSRPKSNPSSVLSSEELSPLRPLDGDDVALSSYASKLRPINVPCRWNSGDDEDDKAEPRQEEGEGEGMENENNNEFCRSSYYYGLSGRVSSPETIISLEHNSFPSIKVCVDDLHLTNSPSSPAASSVLCQEEQVVDDDVMSSYVIEINSDYRDGIGEAVSIDEAIAWAKESFHTHTSSSSQQKHNQVANEGSKVNEVLDREIQGHGTEHMHSLMGEQRNWTTEEGKEQPEEHTEMELLEEEIRLWASGKETNIRLLLSALHHILWSNSGWYAVPLTNLIDSSHVKKAYQKARLCLHPDKLQQRGATPQQKYVAEKVFAILQDAWTAFISEDVFFK